MADLHYEADETLKPGRDLMDTMRAVRTAWDRLTNLRADIIERKLGSTDYTQVAEQFGYSGADAASQETNAEASFAEIDSAFGAGNAAIRQMLSRHL